MLLKWCFWLLVIGNAALFAMQWGYLGATGSEHHEPTRLMQQLHPEALSILPANSAKLVAPVNAGRSVASAPAATGVASDDVPVPASVQPEAKPSVKAELIACTEFGNFNSVEARKFDSQLSALNLSVKPTTHSVQEASSHMVYIPSQDGKDGADRRAAELRRLGIQDFYIMPESQPNAALRWGISLGVFRTEEAAKAYIGELIPKGVRSARIIARSTSSTKQVYQWRNLNPTAKSTLEGLRARFPNQELRNCAG